LSALVADVEVTWSGTHGCDMTPQQSNEQFRLLIAAVKDYAIFLLDPEGTVVSWNAGAERIKGYRAQEIVGESFTRFYLPQDVAAGVPASALRQATEHGRFVGYGWRLRKDGSRFYAHVTITALRDANDHLWGFAKVTQDITEQRRQQEELAASAARFRTTVEHLLDPLVLLSAVRDADGQVVDFRYEYVNPAHVEQAPIVEGGVVGRRMRELYREAGTGGLFEAYRKVVETGEPIVWDAFDYQGTFTGLPIRRVLDIRVAKLDDGVLVTWRNVTERLRTQQQLVEVRAQAEISQRLQASLLPAFAVDDPAVELLTRYEPGGQRALLGADFYDALQLHDGTIALLVGDVAGHGPDEAGVAVALRVAWRTMVLTGHGPAELLAGLDRVLLNERRTEELFATVACVWVCPDRRRATVAVAGHPAPVLIEAGRVGVMDVPSGPALGIEDGGASSWPATTLTLEPPWLLLCYTDGLIEGRQAPKTTERFGIERLVDRIAALAGRRIPVTELLDRLLAEVKAANGGQLSDDVAIVSFAVDERPRQ
jgi:PAS domain S-box-containing protein